MRIEEFQERVRRLTIRQSADPDGFRRATILTLALGYAALACLLFLGAAVFILALLLIFVLPGVGVFVALSMIGLAWSTARALWVRFERPRGIVLAPGDAPRLLEVAEGARIAASAPRWRAVVLTSDFNAAVQQVPRLGVFGWYRNTLVIGLPVLMGMTTEEVAAVLTHEMGHLSRAHGRLGAWAFRQSVTLDRVGRGNGRRTFATIVMGPFLGCSFPASTRAWSCCAARRSARPTWSRHGTPEPGRWGTR